MSQEHPSITTYQEPVSLLMILGEEAARARPWPDYLQTGLNASHTAELVRMATGLEFDEAEYPAAELWAPLHAWRALGQLRAGEAAEPLLDLMNERAYEDDGWALEELPDVFAMLDPPPVKALEHFLDDRSRNSWARTAVAKGLVQIVKAHPELRGRCVSIVARQLHACEFNHRTFNGMIVCTLIDLEAVEAADLIEQAFAGGWVDEFCAGGWLEVRYELGLGPQSTGPAPMPQMLRDMFDAAADAVARELSEVLEPLEPLEPFAPMEDVLPVKAKTQSYLGIRAERKRERKARKRNRK